MAASPSFGCGPLRALRWPDVPMVDLLSEFPWIISDGGSNRGESWGEEPAGDCEHLDDASGATRRKRPRNVQGSELEGRKADQGLAPSTKQPTSPYKQHTLAVKPKRSPLSPAQRAAKKILQFKTELQQIVAPDTIDITSTGLLAGGVLGLQRAASPPPHPRHEIAFSQPGKSDEYGIKAPKPSPSPQKSPSTPIMTKQIKGRSPTSKARARVDAPVPTPDELNLREKQGRLAAWLAKNTKREREDSSSHNRVSYSLEVDARVHAAVTCKDDEDGRNDALWVDPVRSLLAAEVTSETVLGGFIPTRRLAFQPPTKQPKSPTAEAHSTARAPYLEKSVTEASPLANFDAIESISPAGKDEAPKKDSPAVNIVVDRARDIQLYAQQQVTAGSIDDALATLQNGIHQILYEYQDNHEELRYAGFNYSIAAHQLASKLQLRYRHRYRERVLDVVLLQRAWRRFRRSRRSRSSNNYDDAHAATIQRSYNRHYRQIARTRSAARIQKCFRVYQSQKHILHFHQACRLLLARERHRRELERQVQLRRKRMWTKLKILLRVLRLWVIRRDSITCLQKRWRGGQCRARYATMLHELRESESERRKREDAFIAGRVDALIVLYRKFLCNTRRGRQIVKYQGELPWIRFRRLRRDDSVGWSALSTAERIELLDRMYNGRQVGTWEWWVMARELSFVSQEGTEGRQRLQDHQLDNRIEISSSGLQFLLDTDVAAASAATRVMISPGVQISPGAVFPSGEKPRWLSAKLKQEKRSLVDQVDRVRRKLSKTAARAGWRGFYYPKAYYWHHRFLATRARTRTRGRLEEDFRRDVASFIRKQFRDVDGNGPRYACAACYEPFATTAELFAHSRGTTVTGAACATAKQRARVEWEALAGGVNTLRQRQQHRTITWKRILNRPRPGKHLPRFKFIDTNVLNAGRAIPYRDQASDAEKRRHWGFAGFKLTQSLACRIHRQSDRVTVQQLTAIALEVARSGALGETNVAEIPLQLVGYVFQALGGFDLDEGEGSSEGNDGLPLPLLRTALYQLMSWNVRSEHLSAARSRTAPVDRSLIGNDQAIDAERLLSLLDAKRTPRHRLWKVLVVKSSKSMLDRCRQTLQSFGKRLQGRRVRQNAYRQNNLRGDGNNGSTAGPSLTRSSPVTVSKRVGQNGGQGSVTATAPSTVVPITI